MSTIWTHELLDALRQVGDPPLDAPGKGKRPGWRTIDVRPASDELPGIEEVRLLQSWRAAPAGARPDRPEPDDPFWGLLDPPAADEHLAIGARDLFVLYGGEICAALLLASLPHSYAALAGSRVLAHTKSLESDARRRIAETSQLVVEVMVPDDSVQYAAALPLEPGQAQALRPGGHAFARVLTTRLTHAVIRDLILTHDASWQPKDPVDLPRHRGATGRPVPQGVPINQEDLLGTLSTFTVTVLDVLDKLGIEWPPLAQQGYLDLWDRVGALLGIGTPDVVKKLPKAVRDHLPPEYRERLRPRTVAEFRALTELIIDRCWPRPVPGYQVAPFEGIYGKQLTRALLDELQSSMPRGMERMPLMLMRYLVHDDAEELLGLGGGGLMDAMANVPRWLQNPLWPRRKGMAQMSIERMMRMAATEVSRRSFVHFMQSKQGAPFRFPGLTADDVRIPTGRSSG